MRVRITRPNFDSMAHWLVIAFLLVFSHIEPSFAETRQKANRLFERLAGVPLSLRDSRRTQIEYLIDQGRLLEAARIATDDDNFYNVTVKHWATPLSNRDEDYVRNLSDFVAMVIGTVRDNRDARELLSGDFIYQGNPSIIPPAVAVYAVDNNQHYDTMDTQRVNLRQALMRVEPQNAAIPDTAGVLTSREWGNAHLTGGTNRRPVEFAFREFLCKPVKELADATAPDIYVRRDVDRNPGGSTATYVTTCRGCHAGLDGLAGAWVHFDFNQATVWDPAVNGKTTKNSVFAAGNRPVDDSWENLWTEEQNRELGWRGPLSGTGVRAFGQMLANSRAFSSCLATRVFSHVCRRAPMEAERKTIDELANSFEGSGYNLRDLFERAAVTRDCLGR